MTFKGVARAKRTREHKAKPLSATDKRQDPRKARGKATPDPELVTWSY